MTRKKSAAQRKFPRGAWACAYPGDKTIAVQPVAASDAIHRSEVGRWVKTLWSTHSCFGYSFIRVDALRGRARELADALIAGLEGR